MPHAQPGMTSLLNIGSGSAKAVDQEVPESPLGSLKVVLRVERGQNIIAGNLPVERRHEALESRRANRRVHFLLVHRSILAVRGGEADSKMGPERHGPQHQPY